MIRGGLALSIVIARGGAPSKIVDEREVRAPEDGSGMRQGLDEIDVGGERLRPFRRRAKGSLGPMGKSVGYLVNTV